MRSRSRTAPLLLALLLVAAACTDATDSADPQGDPSTTLLGEAVAAEPGGDGIDAAASTGQYVADSGFRPDSDGFSFPNYVNDGTTNMRPQEMHELFGDAICASGTGPACRMSSPAVTWMQQVNAAMNNGHCEGMAIMSQAFHLGTASPATYGGDTTFALTNDNEELAADIAKWWATQAAPPMAEGREKGLTPSGVVERLRTAFDEAPGAENTYTIAFFKSDGTGGHAVTPFAIEDRGEGVVWILIYDNNHPGETRAIEVDTLADTWTYEAATNPDSGEEPYRGDASAETLLLASLAERVVPAGCPFCAGEADEALGSRNQLSLTGPGSRLEGTDFYVSDVAGRVFGRRDEKVVQDIDGVEVIKLTNPTPGHPAPMLDTPAVFDLEVAIGAPPDRAAEDMAFSLVGAGYDVYVDDIDVAAGGTDGVKLSSDGSYVMYGSHTTSTPWIEVATGVDDGAHFDLRIRASRLAEPGRLYLGSPGDDADVQLQASADSTLEIEVVRIAPDGTETTVSTSALDLPSSRVALLPLTGWTAGDTLEGQYHDNGEVAGSFRLG